MNSECPASASVSKLSQTCHLLVNDTHPKHISFTSAFSFFARTFKPLKQPYSQGRDTAHGREGGQRGRVKNDSINSAERAWQREYVYATAGVMPATLVSSNCVQRAK